MTAGACEPEAEGVAFLTARRQASHAVLTFGTREPHDFGASFVQRWKLNPITWDVWVNVLRRGPPASMLWLLQHPLDGTRQALSRMLRTNELSELSPRRMHVMRRRPLLEHLTRVGLADLTIDTWPYTAHTTAADALWAGGAPWLALGASEDRMDSLLSSAVLASAGALPLVAGTLRSFEDAAVAMMRSVELQKELPPNPFASVSV